ncbi:MAG TPA: hypothetical protein PKE55_05645 [Kiritimatiellia bacterium]|nr:hypothetical protein [Kiritimatiellia bacterium]
MILTLLVSAAAMGEGVAVNPDPLVVWPRHSADTQGDAFTLDPTEVDRVLELWRAGSYGVDVTSVDGYHPGGPEPTHGLRHSADFLSPAWSLSYHEMLRFMALSRARTYRYQADSVDGFTPEPDRWVYQPPAPGSTPGATRYVSATSTNPLPPFDSLATAAQTIQAAIDISETGDLVLVDQGIYNQGVASNHFGLSRVVVTSGVTLASIHGPASTIIEGSTNAFIRGVMLQHTQAVFSGFTVRHSASRGNSASVDVRDGGGVLALAAAAISNCVFHDNKATPWGHGGGLFTHTMKGKVTRVHVYNNDAYFGGGIAVLWGFNTTINHAEIHHNTANLNGGGLLADNTRLLYNLVVYENHAAWRGGGVYLSSNCDLWFSTIARNTSGYPGAGVSLEGNGNAVRNTIVFENDDKDVYSTTGNNTFRYSFASTLPETGLTVVSNVTTAPIFVNADERNFRVQTGSSTLNKGEMASWMATFADYDLAPRVTGSAPDLGAFEWDEPSITSPPAFYIPGKPVVMEVGISFPAGRRTLTYGIQVVIPPEWELLDLHGSPDLEASPDLAGYLAVGELGANATLTLTLQAPSDATGPADLRIAVSWMTAGMEAMQTSVLQPYPFEILPLYPIQAMALEGGSLSTTGGWYAAGAWVQVTATAEPGWRFGQWLGDLEGAEVIGNQISIPVSTGLAVYAEFVRVHTLMITSPHGVVTPGFGSFSFDQGTVVTTGVQSASVQVGSTNYVCVGWIGTGSTPAMGSDRSVVITLDEDSSIAWQWARFSAQHASRGYRAAGVNRARVECRVEFEPSPTLHSIWWQPDLPPGSTIESVTGPGTPVINQGRILISENLNSGLLEFEYEVILPSNLSGPVTIGGTSGVNSPDLP